MEESVAVAAIEEAAILVAKIRIRLVARAIRMVIVGMKQTATIASPIFGS